MQAKKNVLRSRQWNQKDVFVLRTTLLVHRRETSSSSFFCCTMLPYTSTAAILSSIRQKTSAPPFSPPGSR